ncbi:MAG: transcriptional repressor LexA [Gammaproteobacteria bacterium]|nr:MAG: transcriptional repressor LexA [Gammaproteobacteria bacterium]
MTNNQRLTDKQRLTLDFIEYYIARYTVPPKLQEIAEGIGISSRGVAHRYVRALADTGFIETGSGRHRGIRLLKPNPHRSESILPLLGKIAAGKPIEAIPGEDQIDLQDFFGHNNFAVRVQGDSMIEAGILDGDTVIIEFRETADDGDIVVALIDEAETTLKRFKRSNKGHYIKLIPANKDMEEMVYEASRIRIQGVLIGQLRKY